MDVHKRYDVLIEHHTLQHVTENYDNYIIIVVNEFMMRLCSLPSCKNHLT